MWPMLKDFFSGLLYDRSVGQRYLVSGLFLLGTLLKSGGVIPGTDLVLPFLHDYTEFGEPVRALALFLAAGHGLPTAEPYKPDVKK